MPRFASWPDVILIISFALVATSGLGDRHGLKRGNAGRSRRGLLYFETGLTRRLSDTPSGSKVQLDLTTS